MVEYRKEQTYKAYVTYGFKSLCGFNKSWEDIIKTKSRRRAKDDDREPEQIISRIKNKLKGNNDERTDISGNTDTQ